MVTLLSSKKPTLITLKTWSAQHSKIQ